MRERESESWGHLKSGDCHQRFLIPILMSIRQ